MPHRCFLRARLATLPHTLVQKNDRGRSGLEKTAAQYTSEIETEADKQQRQLTEQKAYLEKQQQEMIDELAKENQKQIQQTAAKVEENVSRFLREFTQQLRRLDPTQIYSVVLSTSADRRSDHRAMRGRKFKP